MQILNREKKSLCSLGRFYFSTNEMYIVSNRSSFRSIIEHRWNSLYLHRSLVPKVDTKIGEKQIRGEIFIEGKKRLHRSNRHSFFFFFLKLLYSSLLLRYRGYNYRFHETETRNGDAISRDTFFSHFSRGEMEIFADSGQLRGTVLLGKRRKRKMIFRV